MTQLGRLFVLLSLFNLALPQDKPPMSLIDSLETPSLGSPRISPDGNSLIYTLGRPDWEANRSFSHIWRQDGDGKPYQITNGDGGEQSPRWSPDGSLISFIAKRGDDKTNQIYLIGRSGEARRLTSHETSPSRHAWHPTGRHIYFLAVNPKTPEQKKRDRLKDDVFAFDENYRQRHLWRVSVDGGDPERITQGDYSITSFSLSHDGFRVVVHRAPTPLFDDQDESEVWVVEINGGKETRLTSNSVTERNARISPDNSTVLFLAGANNDFETYYDGNLFLAPTLGGSHRLFLEDMPHGVQAAEWAPDSRSIFFLANMGLRTELFRFDIPQNELQQLTDGKHSLRSWHYRPESGKHSFQVSDAVNPGDVWLASGRDLSTRRLTHVFDYLTENFRLPRQEGIRWTSKDGQEVEGLLFYPLDYREGQRYPLVVQTHGGPAASDKYGFPRSRSAIPKLTAMGYAVFKPNYRGSTGYGDDFLRDMVGHYFQNAHLDVMSGVDYLIEKGIADPDRMAKMGWSAGGHMTNKIITFTDRFKAASSGAGAVNWISMYGQSDVRIYRTPWFGGTPWQKDAPIETYWEHSPLKDIWKVKTPTLVLVGENDVRVPAPQSVELYRALKTNGVPTRLYIAPREPHGWRELRHQLFKMNVELDWFEKYVRGNDYEWETPPGKETEEDAKTSTLETSGR